MKDYDYRFGATSIKEKRADLMCNPFFNKNDIECATDDEVGVLHRMYFEAFASCINETLGENIFDEDDWM